MLARVNVAMEHIFVVLASSAPAATCGKSAFAFAAGCG
jgi:hypothetical protein